MHTPVPVWQVFLPREFFFLNFLNWSGDVYLAYLVEPPVFLYLEELQDGEVIRNVSGMSRYKKVVKFVVVRITSRHVSMRHTMIFLISFLL